MTPCLSESDFERYHAKDLPEGERLAVERHLAECTDCARRFDEFTRSAERLIDALKAGQSDPAETRTHARTPRVPGPSGSSIPPGDSAGRLPHEAVSLIPGFELLREIHRGGQGVVYLAMQKSTHRRVAIKVMREGPFAGARDRARFEREVQVLGQLKHPNIVAIHDSGVVQGNFYFVMDYISGQSLDEFIGARDRPIEDVLRLFSIICEAVETAHRSGVVHRDLKPSNIRVDADGNPHILDFGLAKVGAGVGSDEGGPAVVSLTGQFIGSLPWASPEQAEGAPERVDARTDVYSLGVILYQMLTGQFPYTVVGNMRDVLDNILRAEPARPSTVRRQINNEIETIVLKCLAKERERRYQSSGELARDILHYLRGEPIDAKRDSVLYVLRKSARRNRGIIVWGSLLAVSVATLGGLTWRNRRAAQDARRAAAQSAARAEAAARKVAAYEARLARDEYLAATLIPPAVAEPPPANAAAMDPTGTLAVNCVDPPQRINPFAAVNMTEVILCEWMYERLFTRNARTELSPNPHLVSAIDESDPAVRIVHLRPGLRWQDGRPLTAEDVAFSWRQANSSPVNGSRRRDVAHVKDVTAVDPTTARFVLDAPHPTWRLSMGFEIVPRHLFEPGLSDDPTMAASPFYQTLHRRPVGSGPFRLESWDDSQIVLRRWAEYSGEAPRFDRFIVRWHTNPPDILAAFLGGRLDLCTLTDDQYHSAIYEKDFTRVGFGVHVPTAEFLHITWNCRPGSIFADSRVRRAMAHALDIDKIRDWVTNNRAAPCYGPWPLESAAFNLNVKRLAHSPQLAAELLDRAGWRLGDGGVRVHARPDGTTQPFEFSVMLDAESPRSKRVAEVYQADLADIGVRMKLDSVSYTERLIPRRAKGEFDALVFSISPPVDPGLMAWYYRSDGQANYGGFSEPRIDQLFDQAERTIDLDQRTSVFQELHSAIYEAQPMAFLYHRPALWAVSKNLRGLSFSPRGPYLFQPGLLHWWVPR